MVRNDIDVCHPKRGGEKVLFHKHIFENESLARVALQEKNLAPGEIAVARFYVNYSNEYLGGVPSYDAIRMIMAIGGAAPHKTNDTYFFNDSYVVGENDYLTRAEVEEVLSGYYTKEEVEELISNIEIPEIDTTNLATKEDVSMLNSDIEELENKVDTIPVIDESKLATKEELNNKVDASYVEEYFTENVEESVNSIIEEVNIPNMVVEEIAKQDIENKVNDAVDEKLKDFDGVTTETIDDVLANNEYFTTNVITPIETITEQVKTIETQIKDLDTDIDGGEEEEWEL